MKNIFILFIILQFCNNLSAQERLNNLIIGKTIKIERLEIAQNDFPNTMTWGDAKKACANLGEGWRLPTVSELKILYQYKDDYLSNMSKAYWSSSDADYDYAVIPDFYFNNDKSPKKGNAYSVRAIRLNKDFFEPIIGVTKKIGVLEIAQYDFPKRMNYFDAKKACADLGQGWRLPTKEELDKLFFNKDEIGGFTNNNYWSFTTNNGSGAWSQNFSNGFQNLIFNIYTYNVRAVKTK